MPVYPVRICEAGKWATPVPFPNCSLDLLSPVSLHPGHSASESPKHTRVADIAEHLEQFKPLLFAWMGFSYEGERWYMKTRGSTKTAEFTGEKPSRPHLYHSLHPFHQDSDCGFHTFNLVKSPQPVWKHL